MSEATLPPNRGSLAKKLAGILSQAGRLKKTGHNSFFNYDFVTESDLSAAVRDLLAAANVFLFTSFDKQEVREIVSPDKENATGKHTLLTLIESSHTFVDGDTGETFTVRSQGQACDNGDKGCYKAETGAVKYMLYKTFLFPTGDAADPEYDNPAGNGEHFEPGSTPPTADQAARARAATAGARAPATQQRPPAQVRRDPEVEAARNAPPVEDGFRWEDLKIHFGKNKDRKLGELDDKALDWYIREYTVKPYNGKIDPRDTYLRQALDWIGDNVPAQ